MEILVEDHPGERVDAFLASRLENVSRSRIQTLIREQFIQINGHPAKPRDAVKMGDKITVILPEAVPLDAEPQDIRLEILFEDDDLVVLNKAPGMVVHRHREILMAPWSMLCFIIATENYQVSAVSSARGSSTDWIRTLLAASLWRNPMSRISR